MARGVLGARDRRDLCRNRRSSHPDPLRGVRRRGGDDLGQLPQRHRTLRRGDRNPRVRAARRHQPARRCAADPAVVRRGADRGDAPRRRVRDDGTALHARAARGTGRGMAGGHRRRHDRGARCLGARALFLEGRHPRFAAQLRQGRGGARLSACGRLCLYACGACGLSCPGPAEVELVEGLEQLRFLVHGVPVLCVEVPDRGRRFWELNNPPDVERIEAIMVAEQIA